MQRIDRLLLKAGKTIQSTTPKIMAILVTEHKGKWHTTACYYKDDNGFSEVEVYENESDAIKSAERKKNGKSFPVIHFVRASTITGNEKVKYQEEIR